MGTVNLNRIKNRFLCPLDSDSKGVSRISMVVKVFGSVL